jgi:hypothetical protein
MHLKDKVIAWIGVVILVSWFKTADLTSTGTSFISRGIKADDLICQADQIVSPLFAQMLCP